MSPITTIPFDNVFRGPDAIAKFFNPDNSPPVPLVEISDKLNPFHEDGVRIYAKMLSALPGQNVKALPALNMLLHDPSAANKSIVEASSGSTVLSLAMCARILYGNEDVTAHVTNKKHPDSLRLLRFFGLKVSLYGGLAQQEPSDPRGIMARLRRRVTKDSKTCYPGQYDNDNNWKAHVRWTGSQIYRQLPEINVLCTTVGTGGCIAGTGYYLKSVKPEVKVVGVCNVFGDPTPGPRHFPGFESSKFPWRETIDSFEDVASVESFAMSMQLSREGLICGPSSGEALVGLLQYLQKLKDAGGLASLADPLTGEISCVFICCDLPYQYLPQYFEKLGEAAFPAIHNKVLLNCDQDRYDERWELDPTTALHTFVSSPTADLHDILCSTTANTPHSLCTKQFSTATTIIDLRQSTDYQASHLPGSLDSPLATLTPKTGDIYNDSDQVHLYWTLLKTKITRDLDIDSLSLTRVLVLCYDGEVSRLATSLLRARGCEAYSVFGGFGGVLGRVQASAGVGGGFVKAEL